MRSAKVLVAKMACLSPGEYRYSEQSSSALHEERWQLGSPQQPDMCVYRARNDATR